MKIAKANLETLGHAGQFLSAVIHDLATEPEMLFKFRTLSSRDPKNMKYPNEIGRIELKRGNIEEARKSFEKADQVAPLNIDRLEQMASLYLQTMNTEKAAEKYAEILAVSPEQPELKFSMYKELLNSGDKHTAQQFCQTTSSPLSSSDITIIEVFYSQKTNNTKKPSMSMRSPKI